MTIHPLDSYSLSAGGLDDAEIERRNSERARQQAKLDNDLAQRHALKYAYTPDRRRPSPWWTVVLWVGVAAASGLALFFGLTVGR